MSTPLPPDPVLAVAAGLLDCLCDTLTEYGVPVCRCSLVPGAVTPADMCCECGSGSAEGQASVRVAAVWPTLNFPNPIPGGRDTAQESTALAVQLEMTVFRCAHSLDEEGNPPTEAEVTADAVAASRDRLLMSRAARCCFPDRPELDEPSVLIGAWNPIGPDGGCHGGAQMVTVLVYDCAC